MPTDEKPLFDPNDPDDMLLSSSLSRIGDEVTALCRTGTVDAVVVFMSTVPDREHLKVLSKPEAVAAGARMSPAMLVAIESAPPLPLVRVFSVRSDGQTDQRDMPLLAERFNRTEEPS